MDLILSSVPANLRIHVQHVIMKKTSQSGLKSKELIKTLKQVNPHVESNIFRSVENVNIDTVIAYKQNGVKHNFLDEYDNK